MRACAGKMQRRGKEGPLNCHLIDLDLVDHLDLLTLRKYLSQDSEILGRKHTGLCAKCQRKVAKTIKRARNFGLIPHLGQFVVQDSRPLHRDEFYHDLGIANAQVRNKFLYLTSHTSPHTYLTPQSLQS